jgi:undecaprenyl-diphosphatase
VNIFITIILGLIEGATEFLPISSTFHLLMAQRLWGIEQTEFVKLFSVFIQSGAILSVLFLYFQDLWRDKSLAFKAGLAFIPTAIVGLLLHDFIKDVLFSSPISSIVVFIVVGILFILLEKKTLQLTKAVENISYKHALIIGLAQALAVIPGVSRSGAVIVAMMMLGFKRSDSARFSFILSIPTIFAASALDLYDSKDVAFQKSATTYLLVIGFVVAFISSLIIVKWFIQYLQKNSLEVFGWYRIIAGLVLLLLTITL